MWLALALGLALVAVAAVAAYAAQGALGPTPVTRAGYSNIERADYLGPEVCQECHQENFDGWTKHPHRTMNADATAATVRGDFSGVEIAYRGFSEGPTRRVPAGRARFHRTGTDYSVSLLAEDGATLRRFRVTRTVGSRVQQMYIGVQITGPEPPGDPVYTDEVRLPFGFLVLRGEWHSTPYFDHGLHMEDPAAPIPHGTSLGLDLWGANCATCHNTYPYLQRLQVKTPYHAGFRRHHFEGKLTAAPTGTTLSPKDLVTVGISCESCHFGGREHVLHEAPMRFMPVHDELRFTRKLASGPEVPEREKPELVNAICRQCHGRGVERYPGGGVCPNSAEAYDMGRSCNGQLRCTHCHNPHQAGPQNGGGADNPAHNAVCVSCHEDYAPEEARVAHSRHPAGAKISCMDCHMPRVVMGLETVTRTHSVTAPTNLRTYVSGAPNACNLCHLDETPGWAFDAMARMWGRPAAPAGARQAISRKTARELWLRSEHHMTRMAGAHAHSRSPLGDHAIEPLVEAMTHDYPLVRVIIRPALERLLGRTLGPDEYDIDAPADVRARQLATIIRNAGS